MKPVGRQPASQPASQIDTVSNYTSIRYVQRMLENHTAAMWVRDYLSLLGGRLMFMLVASERVADDRRRSPERLRRNRSPLTN